MRLTSRPLRGRSRWVRSCLCCSVCSLGCSSPTSGACNEVISCSLTVSYAATGRSFVSAPLSSGDIMPNGNLALAFGAALAGGVMLDYGVKNVKAGWANASPSSGSGAGSGNVTAQTAGTSQGGAVGKPGKGTGKFSAAQKMFAAELSRTTGLDINVIFAWMQNEQPPGSASAPNGKNNWLNVGATDSGFYGGDIQGWQNPITAADLTAQWMSGQAIGTGGYSSTGYAGAASSITSILHSAGQDAANQIAAIQHSGWASGGETAMMNIYQELTK